MMNQKYLQQVGLLSQVNRNFVLLFHTHQMQLYLLGQSKARRVRRLSEAADINGVEEVLQPQS